MRNEDVWFEPDSGNYDEFVAELERTADPTLWPLAADIENNVLIYAGDAVRSFAASATQRRAIMTEWVHAWRTGPGIIVIRNAFADHSVVDCATALFDDIIERQHPCREGGGDHFAAPGANDRIWNALQKHCLADPENFARYYANATIALASDAWLGKGYQVTAQVNRVNPGGATQVGHRDYHLGFMDGTTASRYPQHVHGVSPMLTLQGTIAHCDMPIESGPTLYLPGSQRFAAGYCAYGRAEFQDYFNAHRVQLPLHKGDVVFFNPAVMHATGENRTRNVSRLANLLQVSSPFGRSIETVDRVAMATALYPNLVRLHDSGVLSDVELEHVVAATAEGYAFPTNLDRDPPVDGIAPGSQAEMLRQALRDGLDAAQFAALLAQSAQRRET